MPDSTPTPAAHDTLATRLAEILLRLNLDDSFSRQELAETFGVSERTIYRDLNRLAGVVECLPDGRYSLTPAYRSRLQMTDLQSLAQLSGIQQLLPDSSPRALLGLLDQSRQDSLQVRTDHYEHQKPDSRHFQALETAIRQHRRCRLQHAGKQRLLEPYRLISHKGIWYLAATEAGQLKAFTFSRISALQLLEETFSPDPQVAQEIDEEDDIWFSRQKMDVQLWVAAGIAYYFQRRNLLPRQQILQQQSDGSLLVACRVSHANQILPLIRYWLPNIRILQPASLQDALLTELDHYLCAIRTEASPS